MGLAEKRKDKVQKIKDLIYDACINGRIVQEEKLIAVVQTDFGASRRTIQEYLKQLEFSGFIERKEGLITLGKEKTQLIL